MEIEDSVTDLGSKPPFILGRDIPRDTVFYASPHQRMAPHESPPLMTKGSGDLVFFLNGGSYTSDGDFWTNAKDIKFFNYQPVTAKVLVTGVK